MKRLVRSPWEMKKVTKEMNTERKFIKYHIQNLSRIKFNAKFSCMYNRSA